MNLCFVVFVTADMIAFFAIKFDFDEFNIRSNLDNGSVNLCTMYVCMYVSVIKMAKVLRRPHSQGNKNV
jgi:uncharacterized membrane protein